MKLESMDVPSTAYSLDGSSKPNATILLHHISLHNHSGWEVLQCDEQGREHDAKAFGSEAEACQHILEFFEGARAPGLNR